MLRRTLPCCRRVCGVDLGGDGDHIDVEWLRWSWIVWTLVNDIVAEESLVGELLEC